MIITYKENKLNVQKGTSVIDLLKEEIEKNKILACMYNNEVKSLDYKLQEDGNIELLDFNTTDGRRVYIRGVMYIMSKAFAEIYPKALLTVNYQLANAMYCKVDNMKITDEILENVRKRMQEIINQKLSIKKVTMTTEEAEIFYEKQRSLKGIVQLDTKQKSGVSLYYCEDYYNYFYGVMPITTAAIQHYDISSYRDGFLVRFPDSTAPEIIEEYQESKKLFKTLEEYDDLHKILGVDTLYKLNRAVSEKRITDYILLAEALHEKKIAQIADQIAKRKDVKIILIAGPSSSGKTTFAERLGIQLRLNGLKPVTISVDNYFVDRQFTPRDSKGNYDFECIEAIDLELFNKQLVSLLNKEEVELPTFNFSEGKKYYNGNTMRLKSDEILVIEGIHCLNNHLTKAIPREKKYKVYISALTVLNIDYYNRISTTDTRLIRRIVRDHKYRDDTALHTLQMWYSVRRGEAKNIFPYQEDADSMFNSSLIYELSVLKKFAIPLLDEIDNTHPEYSEARRLSRLLSFFSGVSEDAVPQNSLLREFIGGSIFSKEVK